MHKTRKTANRKAKDSVFTDLFGDKKYLFELYKTLHPEDTEATAKSLKDVRLKTVLANGQYNDCSFTIGEHKMVVLEAQSTYNDNILVRALLYIAQILNDYFRHNNVNLYSTRKIIMPEPELYIVYTGKRGDKPDEISLSKEFFGGKDICIDVRRKLYTRMTAIAL